MDKKNNIRCVAGRAFCASLRIGGGRRRRRTL
jgi:hypothetical protein